MHKHPIPEKTFREYVENVVMSYIRRTEVSTPRPVWTPDEMITAIVQVAECPVCSVSMRLKPYPTTILFKKVHEGAKRPDKKDPTDAGFDLYALHTVDLLPHIRTEVAIGVALEMPESMYCVIAGKSTFGAAGVHTFPGVIDSGFRGSLSVFMTNNTESRVTIKRYQKCAQLIFHYNLPIHFESTDELSPSARGEGSQGSTGKF